jgi:hypothetical protein
LIGGVSLEAFDASVVRCSHDDSTHTAMARLVAQKKGRYEGQRDKIIWRRPFHVLFDAPKVAHNPIRRWRGHARAVSVVGRLVVIRSTAHSNVKEKGRIFSLECTPRKTMEKKTSSFMAVT